MAILRWSSAEISGTTVMCTAGPPVFLTKRQRLRPDEEFVHNATYSQREFLDGAKQALTYVSVLMANGDFKAMEGLATNDVVSAAQSNCCTLSVEQRKKLTVDLSDIYFCFLYQIGIIMDDNSDQRFVEATVVYHYVPGLEELRRNAAVMNETVQQLQDKVHVANYRFIRDYTKGMESDWTINQLNHFKLSSVA
ncbi:hypothetical protein V5799_004114 [Amblyomma americanum]|uniref:Juvenile hormone esterase binding protein n=1 Tax=Amblyomma americanum TaxID=6943 RepID=A0AAQ4D714_AMBAM